MKVKGAGAHQPHPQHRERTIGRAPTYWFDARASGYPGHTGTGTAIQDSGTLLKKCVPSRPAYHGRDILGQNRDMSRYVPPPDYPNVRASYYLLKDVIAGHQNCPDTPLKSVGIFADWTYL